MRRALLVLAAVTSVACKHRVDADTCNRTVDQLEHRLRDEDQQVRTMSQVTQLLGKEPDAPRVAGGMTPFDPGIGLRVDGAAWPSAVAAAACARGDAPVRVYLLASPTAPPAQVGARVAWLEAAARAWQVPIEPRLVVRLPREVEATPWPGKATPELRRFAADVFATEDMQARMDKLRARLKQVSGDCFDAIGKHGEDRQLALPHGLRDCKCAVPDLDELIATYHILVLARTEIGWLPLSTTRGTPLPGGGTIGDRVAGLTIDGTTVARLDGAATDPVAPLDCSAHAPIVLQRTDAWAGGTPPEIAGLVGEELRGLADAAADVGLDDVTIVDVRIGTSELTGPRSVKSDVDLASYGSEHAFRLTSDLRTVHRADLAAPADGATTLRVLIPATPRRAR